MTLERFLELMQELEPHDVSVAVAVLELIRGADDSGSVGRDDWVSSVRREYEELELHLQASWRERGGELGGYLEEQVIGRLEAVGIAGRDPREDGWERLTLDAELWEEISVDRDPLVENIEAMAVVLQHKFGVLASESADNGASPPASRLVATGLTKSYGGRKVVNDVDIAVEQGEIVGLLGPNGAGKTTTFYMMVGLISPQAGEVRLDDRMLTGIPMYRRARLGVGYLAQEPSVFRRLTVEQNVMAILETLPLPRAERKQRLDELLSELSIGHLRHSKAFSLSGGERRRLEITRALVQRPKFMLLDEPFAGIDPIAVNDIQQIVAGLRHRGIGVIITDHSVEQTLEIVDRAYIMHEGRIRVVGTVSELVWNDEVAEIYLGPVLTDRMRKRFNRPVAA